jgi:putative heme-binding domain-containing protein
MTTAQPAHSMLNKTLLVTFNTESPQTSGARARAILLLRCAMRTLPLVLAAVTVATAAASGQSNSESRPPGNATAGAAIVAGPGKCLTCHRIQHTGARSGPDLTDIGAIRTVDQLRAALLEPDAEILPENRRYRVVTRDGVSTVGTILNHDTFQVLMRDAKDQLRAFQKADLREHGFVEGSPMPSYRMTLSPQQLADVIAYLSTLKGVVSQ